jgi:transposase-like protein
MHKSEISEDLKNVFSVNLQSDTKEQAEARLKEFIVKWSKYYRSISELKNKNDMEMYFTFKGFTHQIRSMIYTTNWIERLNKDFRRTIKIRNALPNEQAALFLLTKVTMEKEEKKSL